MVQPILSRADPPSSPARVAHPAEAQFGARVVDHHKLDFVPEDDVASRHSSLDPEIFPLLLDLGAAAGAPQRPSFPTPTSPAARPPDQGAVFKIEDPYASDAAFEPQRTLSADSRADMQPLPHTLGGSADHAVATAHGAPTAGTSADPWHEPLPAWEFSRNEYPVLLTSNPDYPRRGVGSLVRKLWLPLLIVAALGALATAYVLFFWQPARSRATTQKSEASSPGLGGEPTPLIPNPAAQNTDAAKGPTPAAPSQQPAVETQTPSRSEGAAAATPKQDAATSTPNQEPAAVARNPVSEPSNNQNGSGSITLQTASFPNEAAANEFAAKVQRAGLPAYVMAADLGRRGAWYRVRIGRFNNSQEALKYAAEARQRARAAGMNLQNLVPVEYGKN